MARIRHIDIRNFRCIQALSWFPSAGLNCLVGPGDSGKSSILDAIDCCLGARRSIQFSDADFYRLNVEIPISITISIGELDDSLKSIESYGSYVRSFNAATREIEDEPEAQAETVLTINLQVGSDLDPVWTLVSDRAEGRGQARFLTWADRTRISPTRIGALADHNLGWRRGSILNRLSEERADTAGALAKAARDARAAFGDLAGEQLSGTLQIIAEVAKSLGIAVGDNLKAMLDANSVSFSGGTIALHEADGVPLRSLGVGSTRLLLAGLQRRAAQNATVILMDELEYGLEPHRIIRLLGSIGAKEAPPPLQAFLTTHSPVALRELRGDQLVVVRKRGLVHEVQLVGGDPGIQGTIRSSPDAFLASSVLVCEGASEVGLLRGLDQYLVSQNALSMTAVGVALVDAGGCDHIYRRANAFRALHFEVAVLRDDDKQPDAATEGAFAAGGGSLFCWRAGRALEDELFASLSDEAVHQLLERAVSIHGEEAIGANIGSASSGQMNLWQCRGAVTHTSRQIMALASRRSGWFKSVTWMEEAARDIVGPCLANAEPGFQTIVTAIMRWIFRA
ncbi:MULTISPECIES: ATP-binding protein [unclassified Mesorhizobium]|uniref:ATP-dependent nuclease n=1 Tax=unclassified Mesorhizobium TaxID=325217 RepID=UPI00112B43AE|nr:MULTISPECIES: ATP-binding protein [unclassified Mesorhizobium]TPK53804.1 DUF2813 domain-containing protein [Mesorhizobium sp. B2-5-2]TPL17187.1 DUF2813 domain-containing protein [Mesorhizobium sp. B2-4-7]TPL33402.1 DUF2813 domain-containing protein [Mesorhizobium sp. B2-4-5]TPM69158.1 DUF2813 domain-containing protein [Mesorhizobium sp. B2-1-6]TPN73643.1 DUF2813 domain-containing protein [Mesorhizobium sp. B1-1-2]